MLTVLAAVGFFVASLVCAVILTAAYPFARLQMANPSAKMSHTLVWSNSVIVNWMDAIWTAFLIAVAGTVAYFFLPLTLVIAAQAAFAIYTGHGMWRENTAG